LRTRWTGWGVATLLAAAVLGLVVAHVPAAAAGYVAPGRAAVERLLAEANEYAPVSRGTTGEHLHVDGHAVVVPDGRGGFLTAIPVVRWPTADGLGQYVLFWHNRTYVGSSSLGTGGDLGHEAVQVAIIRAGRDDVVLKYSVYRPSDPACCPSLPPVRVRYSWNGARLVASRPVPAGALEKNLSMRF
jgi:hypothetical protein